MIRRLRPLLLLGIVVALSGCTRTEQLTLAYFGDFHSQFEARVTDDNPELHGGLARMTHAIEALRAEDPDLVVLCAGDQVQGTPFFNFFAGEPEMLALNRLGVDVMVLGNHEFDNGTAALRGMLEWVDCPVISANVRVDGQPLVPSWTTLERRGLRIAVIGVTTGELRRVVAVSVNPGLTALPELESVTEAVAATRADHDLVVVLSHSGFEGDSLLAARVAGIDLIVGGHDHLAFQEPRMILGPTGAAIPVVRAGSRGEFVGRLQLTWTAGRGITALRGDLLTMDAAAPGDSATAEFVAGYRARLSDELAVVVAQAPDGCSGEGRREQQTPLGYYVAESLRRAAQADIGLQNSGGIRTSIPPGAVTWEEVYAVLPFENTVVRCTLTGAEVQQLVEYILSRRGRRGYAQVAGLHLPQSPDDPILVSGKALDLEAEYQVATNSFVFDGGDGYALFGPQRAGEDLGIPLRDAFATLAKTEQILVNHLKN